MINLRDYEAAFARSEQIDPELIALVSGGSGYEITLRENRAAFNRWRLVARVLVDVSRVDLTVQVLGKATRLPILIAPMGGQGQLHADGEIAPARAASAASVVFIRSEWATRAIDEVAGVGVGRRWQQVFMDRDRRALESLVKRAEECGYEAICITVDNPVRARRSWDVRQGRSTAVPFDPTFTWRDLESLTRQTTLPVVVKGIVDVDDAKHCAEIGVAAVFVSNHGGRQLDDAPGSLDVLPSIVDGVPETLEVYVDGGVRTGADVVKALALGARAVGVGRPILWGLALEGEAGVKNVLELLRIEVEEALALMGQPIVSSLSRSSITPAR